MLLSPLLTWSTNVKLGQIKISCLVSASAWVVSTVLGSNPGSVRRLHVLPVLMRSSPGSLASLDCGRCRVGGVGLVDWKFSLSVSAVQQANGLLGVTWLLPPVSWERLQTSCDLELNKWKKKDGWMLLRFKFEMHKWKWPEQDFLQY